MTDIVKRRAVSVEVSLTLRDADGLPTGAVTNRALLDKRNRPWALALVQLVSRMEHLQWMSYAGVQRFEIEDAAKFERGGA